MKNKDYIKLIDLILEQSEDPFYEITANELKELLTMASYNPKVTYLKKFGGKPLKVIGDLNLSKTPMKSLGNIAVIDGKLDISNTEIGNIDDVKVTGYIWDSGSKRARIRKQKEDAAKLADAEERRQSKEWDIEDTDDEGLKANALFQWLEYSGEIKTISDEEKEELSQLEAKLELLNKEYDEKESHDDELYDQISEIEDRIFELKEKNIDVYNIYPKKYGHYGLSAFEVIGVGDLDGNTYTVGDDEEMEEAALEYAKQYIDDVGIEGFNKSFLEDNIDKDELRKYFEDWYEDDVRDNPESYFDDDDFELTKEQEEEIEKLQEYIENMETLKEELEDEQRDLEDSDSEEYNQMQERIDEIESNIEKAQDRLDSIEPDTEPTDEMIEEKVKDRLDDLMYDPVSTIKDYDLDIKDFIDEDSMAESLVESDGWGIMNSYSGDYDSVHLDDVNKTYYVMRIE